MDVLLMSTKTTGVVNLKSWGIARKGHICMCFSNSQYLPHPPLSMLAYNGLTEASNAFQLLL